jgi:hypothetical protein
VIKIALADEKVSLIDDIDSDLASLNWHLDGDARYILRGKRCALRLHRVILERIIGRPLTEGEECDHIDGDTLNNLRCNLRLVTHQQNSWNRRKRCDAKYSKFKGVSKHKNGNWWAYIQTNGVCHHLGTFATEEHAAHAYDHAARNAYGEFAKLNFP